MGGVAWGSGGVGCPAKGSKKAPTLSPVGAFAMRGVTAR
jgi:hypothetical protein